MLAFRRRWVVPVLLATAAVALISWGRHRQRFKHFDVHEPGMMYRSAWLEPGALEELIERHQIRSVVNLCRPNEMGEDRWKAERRAVAAAGAQLFEASMPMSVAANDPDLAKHLEILEDPDNYPMLVHCQHGVTRTAKMLAIYDIVFREMTAKQSLDSQPLYGRDEHNVHVRAFVANFEREFHKVYPAASSENLRVLRQ